MLCVRTSSRRVVSSKMDFEQGAFVHRSGVANAKNFCAWNYRRLIRACILPIQSQADSRSSHVHFKGNLLAYFFVRSSDLLAGLMSIHEEKELKYTTDMIDRNFNNYSVWQNRRYNLRNLELDFLFL